MDTGTITLLVAVLGVGAALASLILVSTGRLSARLATVETGMSSLRERIGRIEGFLEGLGVSNRLPPNPGGRGKD